MARRLRLEYEGAIYHISSRGNERSDIFAQAYDKERFLEKLAENVEQHHVRVYAYVVMSNHYHLLVETPRANISAFMQQLNTSYTMYFNARHQRVGHVFSGRFKGKLVQGDNYLLKLTRYIHLNPAKIQRVRDLPVEEQLRELRGYGWSSYPGYAGLKKGVAWVDHGPLEELVGQGSADKGEAYRQYVETGLASDDEEFVEIMGRSSKAIGSAGFCRWVEREFKKVYARQGSRVDVAMRRVEIGAKPEEVVELVCRECGVAKEALKKRRSLGDARLLAAWMLREFTGLTQREVSNVLGLKDGSGLGQLLRKAEKRLESDRKFRRLHKHLVVSCSVTH
jgi:REP element-mobilizing transposase RayT